MLNYFNNLKIRTKLLLAFIVIILLVVIVGVHSINALKTARSNFVAFNEDTVAKTVSFASFKDNLHMAIIAAYEYTQIGDPVAQQRAGTMLASAKEAKESFVALTEHSGKEEEFPGKLDNVFEEITEEITLLFGIYDAGESGEALDLQVIKVREAQMRAMTTIHSEIDIFVAGERERSDVENRRLLASAINTSIALTIFIFLTGITLAFIISHLISKPIRKLKDATEEIAQGNIYKIVEGGHTDEIGQLGDSFNKMIVRLRISYEGLEAKVRERTAELELARNKSETLLASIGDGVFGIDRERSIVYFNPQAEVLSGYKASEVVGKPYYDFLKFVKVKNRSENIEFIRTALKGKVADMGNHTVLIRKDKKEIPVADSASPIKDKDGNILGAIVVFRDATQERELAIARAELVSFASHQLKTPLTSMSWSLEILKKVKSKVESKKIVGEIDKSIEDMKKLVSDVLNISRIEQGEVEFKLKPTQLVDIVEDILKESLSITKQRNITIEFTKPTQPLPELNIDPQYTHEVFKNIISNAIKYTKDKVTMSFEKKDGNIIFVCSDNGIGIPKDEQSKIFSKFYVASNVGKAGLKGTGIGLSIAKALVERMGGRVWFESKENKGATFYLSLPFLT